MKAIVMLLTLLLLVGFKEKGILKKPLKREKEKYYIAKFKKEKCNEARKILIESNMRLVASIAKKYVSPIYEYEDLISIGTIGLIKALETYKDDDRNKLSTYAARCIENEILMYLRKNKKYGEEVSIYKCIGKDKDGNDLLIVDTLESPSISIEDEALSSIIIKKVIKNMDNLLTKEEKEIICMRYGIGNIDRKTQKEIAKSLNISRSYVSRIEKNAIIKLRNFTENGNNIEK